MSKIRLSKCSVGEAEIAAVSAVLQSSFLGMGTETAAFEAELGAFFGGGRSVVSAATGTAALQLALQACGIGPGDEVLVPSLTFVASFQAVSATGATPVACDVRRHDGWLDARAAESRLTARTRALMPVHYASGSGGLAESYALAEKHGLRVIEDAAHAFGCTVEGRKVGGFGDVVCFSFDGIKNITCAEGGALVTGDAEVARRARDARLLGVEKDTEKRFAGQRSWDFDVREQGWRYHLSNLNAAIGRVQLRRFAGEFAPSRVTLARHYQKSFTGVPGIRLLTMDYGPVVPHIFPIFIEGGRRDAVREALTLAEIESGIHYKPAHLLTLYGGGGPRLPVTEQCYAEMLSLPLHVDLTPEEQARVIAVVKTTLQSLCS